MNGRLLFVGENGGRVCLALGRKTRGGSQRRINNQESLLELLPRGTDPVEYLRDGEKVETFIVLPYDEGNGRNTGGFLAVATSVRVMILSATSFHILSSVDVRLASCALAPLGPSCVAFISHKSPSSSPKLEYLSVLPDVPRDVIATLPQPRVPESQPPLLLAILPDRFLYLTQHSSVKVGETEGDNLTLPIAIVGAMIHRQTKIMICTL